MQLSSVDMRSLEDDKKTSYKEQAKVILMYVLHHSQSEIKKQDSKANPDATKIDNFAKDFLKISRQLSLITA